MFNPLNKRYIIMTSSKRCICVYYLKNFGICISRLSIKGMWSPPQLIVKNCLPYFCADCDTTNNLHILYQDTRGDILYAAQAENTWNKVTVLKGIKDSPYCKYPFFIFFNNISYIFHVINHNNANILSYQKIDTAGVVSKPEVIDVVKAAQTPYNLNSIENDIIISYTKAASQSDIPGFKVFRDESISDFKTIELEENTLDSILSQSFNKVHIISSSETENDSTNIFYSLSDLDGRNLNKPIKIFTSSRKISNIALMHSTNVLICYWQSADDIGYITSSDDGKSWSTATYISAKKDDLYYTCLRNGTEKPLYSSSFNASPASFKNGYSFILLTKPSFSKPALNDRSNIDNKDSDDINKLTSEISTLKSIINTSNERIDNLKNELNQSILKLEKNEMAYKLIQSEVKKLSNDFEIQLASLRESDGDYPSPT